MSGPVVVIGYIFLIPSILGIVISAVMLIGALSYNKTSETDNTDREFRIQCFKETKEALTAMADGIEPLPVDYPRIESYCECLLPMDRKGEPTGVGSTDAAVCNRQVAAGEVAPVDAETRRLYEDPDDSASDAIVRVAGSGIAIFCGIASFVGGLLGWLLIMKRRVLKCNVCGSAINAS